MDRYLFAVLGDNLGWQKSWIDSDTDLKSGCTCSCRAAVCPYS